MIVLRSELRGKFPPDFAPNTLGFVRQSRRFPALLKQFITCVVIFILFYYFCLKEGKIKPIFNKRIFRDVNFEQIDDDSKANFVIERVFEREEWGLCELLQHYSLQQLIDWHKQKYPSQMLAISIPNAITYFSDAEESETPVSLKVRPGRR